MARSPLDSQAPCLSEPVEALLPKTATDRGDLSPAHGALSAIPGDVFIPLWPSFTPLKAPASGFPPSQVQIMGNHPAHSSGSHEGESKVSFPGSVSTAVRPRLSLTEVCSSREHRGICPRATEQHELYFLGMKREQLCSDAF
uniref:Uncharacterized protein n=1 Tax=Pipistrellus kuhlii TaxID=59472 RepID=A0A7J7ZJB7_PIPKU|nr:hypothetical protein mPipKuh1_009572 [Pipistrellus kuhlii]